MGNGCSNNKAVVNSENSRKSDIRTSSNMRFSAQTEGDRFDDDHPTHNRESSYSQNSRTNSRALSTGGKEEFIGPRLDKIDESDDPALGKEDKNSKYLAIAFFSMVGIGLMNRIFNKLQTIPMYNYPNFLNLLTTFVYIPVCFAYIIPMARNGGIPQEQLDMPKKPFAVMGALDALAGIMQIFSATYLPGPLLILLLQAAIPVSMILSRYMLKAQYNKYQYLGAVIVAAGIATVLAPGLDGGQFVWAIVALLSTVPMTLSAVYKEIALGQTELDPIFLNGWIAVFQLLFSLVLCVPSSQASDPPISISDLPQNMLDGLKCYVGISSLQCADDNGDDCTSDDCNPQGPIFVNCYLFFNQLYNLLIILILKYGSANILYMALTVMVPLGNLAFTLPFIPDHEALKPTDIVGLVVICSGLACYRFADDLVKRWFGSKPKYSAVAKDDDLLAKLQSDAAFRDNQ